MNPTAYDCEESRQLAKLRLAADRVKADAERWPANLTTAREAQQAASVRFLSSLNSADAKTLAEAEARVRELSVVCGTLERAGGSDVLRRKALDTTEAYQLFAGGLARRIQDLDGLKAEALKVLAQRRSDATAAGAIHPMLAEAAPGVVSARVVLERLGGDAQTSLVAMNYAKANGINHQPRTFEDLLSVLTSALPASA